MKCLDEKLRINLMRKLRRQLRRTWVPGKRVRQEWPNHGRRQRRKEWLIDHSSRENKVVVPSPKGRWVPCKWGRKPHRMVYDPVHGRRCAKCHAVADHHGDGMSKCPTCHGPTTKRHSVCPNCRKNPPLPKKVKKLRPKKKVLRDWLI